MDELASLKNLKDIKNIVEVPDDSLTYLILVIVAIIFIMAIVYYYTNKYFKNKNLDKKTAIKKLQNLDFNNAKEVAYNFDKYCHHIKTDENHTQIKKLSLELKTYKYKKSVDSLDKDLIAKIKAVLNV
jgi:hypothetical protein